MKENWLIDLFEKQNRLDTYIRNKTEIEVTLNDILNAYFVEVGEFLNEVRAFKYWTVKEIDTEKAREEFVDGLHFLLSIGNFCWGLDKVGIFSSTLQERLEKLEQDELNLYRGKEDIYRNRFVSRSVGLYKYSGSLNGTLEDYMDYFVFYIKLGYNVGMSTEDIINEYNKKHEINYVRQTEGY